MDLIALLRAPLLRVVSCMALLAPFPPVVQARSGPRHPLTASPRLSYTITLDPGRPDTVEVALRVSGVGRNFRLAMAVHPEYDDRYWRFVEQLRVTNDRGEAGGSISREDSTLWRVHLTADAATVRYRVRVAALEPGPFPGSWRPFLGRGGALVNGPDFLLYLPDYGGSPASLTLKVPAEWRIATGLEATSGSHTFRAGGAAELLDAPLLAGPLHEWRFREGSVTYTVAYLPSDSAAPFDTAAFVRDLRRLVRATVDVFGGSPFRRYVFLLRDGGGGALEHRNSVTLGVSSRALARDPDASLDEIAHEFFHGWNLVALRPAGYGGLSYRPPSRTRGLWWGEGVTMYYADLLVRRAGLAPAGSRIDYLAGILGQYYDNPANLVISPEEASLSFGDTPVENGAALANYYLQGQVIGFTLDGFIRDFTNGTRTLDDVLRVMYRGRRASGFTEEELRSATERACRCDLGGFFQRHVSGAQPPDVRAALARLGMRLVIDTVPALDARGQALPEVEARVSQRQGVGPLRLVLLRSAGAWAGAGLRTGDTLTAVNGTPVRTGADFRRTLAGAHPGDGVSVEVLRGGAASRAVVHLVAAFRTRVRLQPLPGAGAAAERRLHAWLRGR